MTAVLHSRASVASSFVGLLRQNRISSRSHRVRRVAAPTWGWPSRSRAVHASRDDVRPRRRLGVTEEAGAAGAAAEGDPSSRDEDEGTAATHPPPQEDTSTSTAVVGTKRTITTLPSPHKVQLEQRRSLQTLRVRQIIRPLGKTRANDPDKVAWLMESIQEIGLQREEPIDVLEVEGRHYGFSGCHRYEAHVRLGRDTIKCRVIKATKQTLEMHMRRS